MAELSEWIDFRHAVERLFDYTSQATLQRLGYVLEEVLQQTDAANSLHEELQMCAQASSLCPTLDTQLGGAHDQERSLEDRRQHDHRSGRAMIDRVSITQWARLGTLEQSGASGTGSDHIPCACRHLRRRFFWRRSWPFMAAQRCMLYHSPQLRYSEDIDLVQIHPDLIKPILLRFEEVLDFLSGRVTQQKRYTTQCCFGWNRRYLQLSPCD